MLRGGLFSDKIGSYFRLDLKESTAELKPVRFS